MVETYRPAWFEGIGQGGVTLLLATAVAFSLNQLRPSGIPLVGDWSPETQLELDSGASLAGALDEAEALLSARSVLFLDARSRDLFGDGHIQGTVNLPWVVHATKGYLGEHWGKALWGLTGTWVVVLFLAWVIVKL